MTNEIRSLLEVPLPRDMTITRSLLDRLAESLVRNDGKLTTVDTAAALVIAISDVEAELRGHPLPARRR
jgi:hypothetical protein